MVNNYNIQISLCAAIEACDIKWNTAYLENEVLVHNLLCDHVYYACKIVLIGCQGYIDKSARRMIQPIKNESYLRPSLTKTDQKNSSLRQVCHKNIVLELEKPCVKARIVAWMYLHGKQHHQLFLCL